MLQLALLAVRAEKGTLLIDEFENGLHYEVQPQVWRFLTTLAHELDLQVFATTHSLDTVRSFQQAAAEDPGDHHQLIRLDRQPDGLKAIVLNEEFLKTAVDPMRRRIPSPPRDGAPARRGPKT
jgi:predicted ATP-dependent endonuclease of OLD family